MFKLFRSKKEAPDLSFGYTPYEEFKNYLLSGNFASFETAYNELEWDAQTILNESIGLHPDFVKSIQQWVSNSPDSYVSNLFAGVSSTYLAWEARTAATGANVSEKKAAQFFELLEQAAKYLQLSDEINPDHPETSARMIRVYMGLGVEEEATRSYFDAATAMEPAHLMSHLMMANYLAPKWRGSIETMQAFANESMNGATNSLLVTIPLFAITEEWLYYNMMGEQTRHDNYFKDPAIRSRVEELLATYQEEASGSLLIPYVYNYFAFLFAQMNERQKTRELLKKIDGKMTIYPWAYIGIDSNEKLQKLGK
jgi:hypothetical protein